jgi:hypothetical protein
MSPVKIPLLACGLVLVGAAQALSQAAKAPPADDKVGLTWSYHVELLSCPQNGKNAERVKLPVICRNWGPQLADSTGHVETELLSEWLKNMGKAGWELIHFEISLGGVAVDAAGARTSLPISGHDHRVLDGNPANAKLPDSQIKILAMFKKSNRDEVALEAIRTVKSAAMKEIETGFVNALKQDKEALAALLKALEQAKGAQ